MQQNDPTQEPAAGRIHQGPVGLQCQLEASLTWDRISTMHNHVVTTDDAVLRLEFLTEEDAKTFF